MKRGILIILCGLTAGIFAQHLYFNNYQPCQDDTLECKLSWIQDYLSLSPKQFELVLGMHRDREPEVQQLQQKINVLEARLAALEAERIENDQIDFIAFYNYLQDKVDLDKTYSSSTQEFLFKVGSVMDSGQKERFDLLLRDFKNTYPEGS